MLNQRSIDFVRNSVSSRTVELDEALHARLAEVRDGAIRVGAYAGSRMYIGYGNELCSALRARAHLIFSELQRAIGLFPPSNLESLHDDLVAAFAQELGRVASQMRDHTSAQLGGSPRGATEAAHAAMLDRFEREVTRLVEQYRSVDFVAYVEAAKRRFDQHPPPSGTAINVFGNVGVVQSGSHATATVSISVGAEERQALSRALDLVAELVRNARELPAEHQRQMLEVIDQSRAVAAADKPNSSMLRGMFSVLTETVQTLAASGPAMDALRIAALPFGITL